MKSNAWWKKGFFYFLLSARIGAMKTIRRSLLLVALFIIGNIFSACRTAPSTQKQTETASLPKELQALATAGGQVDTPIAPGVGYHHLLFTNPFGDGPVSVHYLVIDWNETEKGFSLALSNCGGTRKRTSEMAAKRRALAAVNGGFYETKDPSRPVHAMKIDGNVIDSVTTNGSLALAFNKGQTPVIEPFSKELFARYDNVLNGYDVTVLKGFEPTATKAERRKARAPRTFIGLCRTNKVMVIAVADGRSHESIGLSGAEECDLVRPFGCDKILNIDGGGSTTMVRRDGADNRSIRLLNVPSDGRERRVCDALLLLDSHSLTAADTALSQKEAF